MTTQRNALDFNSMPLAHKLPALIVAISLLTALVTAGLNYFSARNSLESEARNKLQAVLADRSASLEDWLTGISKDLDGQTRNPSVKSALKEFTAAWNELPSNQTDYLQGLYITDNPHPTGSKEKLDFASDGSAYSAVHASYHPYLRAYQVNRGYYDVFLFDTEGNLVYTVFKELDYATSMITGKWADTDLAAAFKGARDNAATGAQVYYDYRAYGPSHGAPASFMAQAIYDDVTGAFIGVMAVQMPIDQLNHVMIGSAGLGETGEAYIVGEDYKMRSDSRFSETSTILVQDVRTSAVEAVLAGESGTKVHTDYRGQKVLAAFQPVEFMGVTWAALAEQDVREVFAPVRALRNLILIQLVIALGVITLLGLMIARRITGPLLELGGVMNRVASGDYNVTVEASARGDEIGEMAKTLDRFKGDLGRAAEANRVAAFKGTAFEQSSTPMLMIDRDHKVTFVNEAVIVFFDKNLTQFQQVWPGFTPTKVVGRQINLFPADANRQQRLLGDPASLPCQIDFVVGELLLAVTLSAVYSPDGDYIGNVLEFNDVTALRINAGILEARDKIQGIAEFSSEGVLVKANENYAKMTGYNRQDMPGLKHSDIADPEYAASAEYSALWEGLRKGEYQSGIFRYRNHNGDVVWIGGSFSAVLDDQGNLLKVIELSSDITQRELERQKTEEELSRKSREQQEVVEILADGLRKLASGDLTREISTAFSADYEALRADYNVTTRKLREVMQSINTNAGSLLDGSDEISQAADDLSQRTERQASTLEEAASSLEEITTTVQATAEGASRANQVIEKARKNADTGGEVMQQTVSAMTEISDYSEKISQIIGVIDEIAFQTNLLALNAGVEAARAGEAGRGFAVVASEVRALAQRASDAAREIKELISASSEKVGSGVQLVDQAGNALQQIVGSIVDISTLMSEITASTQEQSHGLQEINDAVNQIDKVTQQNAAMVEETTAASHTLRQEAHNLAGLVSRFRTEEDGVASETAYRQAS